MMIVHPVAVMIAPVAACLKSLRDGDVLIVWKLDRLGRTLTHLVSTVQNPSDRGIGLRVLTGKGRADRHHDAIGPDGVRHFATLAEFERDMIRERTMAGWPLPARGDARVAASSPSPKAQVRLAQAAMAQRDTSVSDLCKELRDRARHLPLLSVPTGNSGITVTRACCQNAMMMTGAPIKLTQKKADAADVADLVQPLQRLFPVAGRGRAHAGRCSRAFLRCAARKERPQSSCPGMEGPGGLYAIAAILRDYPRDGTWYLGFVIVDAAQRGRGVGRSIYSTVESWAAARGATEIRLAVLEANEAAERFWRSLGFIEYRRVGPDTFKMRSHRRIELSRRLSGATVEEQQQVRSRAGYLGELGVGFRPPPAKTPLSGKGLEIALMAFNPVPKRAIASLFSPARHRADRRSRDRQYG